MKKIIVLAIVGMFGLSTAFASQTITVSTPKTEKQAVKPEKKEAAKADTAAKKKCCAKGGKGCCKKKSETKK